MRPGKEIFDTLKKMRKALLDEEVSQESFNTGAVIALAELLVDIRDTLADLREYIEREPQ